jgi:hypothetical protein
MGETSERSPGMDEQIVFLARRPVDFSMRLDGS